jgi:alpha/beta superfamily hydrolase
MQLLMRRPEISGFVSVAPPANLYDFTFLAPCPASGIIVHGDADRIVPKEDTEKLVERLQAQKGITVNYESLKGANHFFDSDMEGLKGTIDGYLDQRIAEIDTA